MMERPILFSAPMVKAILAGTKTQTRRVMKPYRGWEKHSVCSPDQAADPWAVWWHYPETDRVGHIAECPFGKPGDRLWVRETWAPFEFTYEDTKPSELPRYAQTVYLADQKEKLSGDRWKPSIHMPRWASRITLEVTEVRVQRLQEISEEDAKAEGIEPWAMGQADIDDIQISDECPGVKELVRLMGPGQFSHRFEFEMLWDSINGKRPGCAWADSPWVWVISFRRVEAV